MKFFTFFFLFAVTCSLNAQHLEVGLSFGNANYLGDLVSVEDAAVIKQFNAATGLFGRINHNKFGAQVSLMHTVLKADDANGLYPERGLHFKTPLTEIALTADYSLFCFKFNFGKSYIEPYISAGAAVYHFNPKAKYNGSWVDLQPLGTEGQGMEGYADPYQRTQIALLAGGGIKFKLNEKIALRTELRFRKLSTDYIDDVSGTAINLSDLNSEMGTEIAALSVPSLESSSSSTTYSRGGDANDMYFVYQISVAYTFGKDPKNNFFYR